MSHIQEPLTLPKHPELLHEINETIITIKMMREGQWGTPEQLEKFWENRRKPTWDDIVELLSKARNAINEQRENPRRY